MVEMVWILFEWIVLSRVSWGDWSRQFRRHFRDTEKSISSKVIFERARDLWKAGMLQLRIQKSRAQVGANRCNPLEVREDILIWTSWGLAICSLAYEIQFVLAQTFNSYFEISFSWVETRCYFQERFGFHLYLVILYCRIFPRPFLG